MDVFRDETGNTSATDEDENGQTNPSEIALAGGEDVKTGKQEKSNHNGSSAVVPSNSDGSPKPSQFQLAKSALVLAVKLFITPHMLLLSVASVYTGWCQSFFFGVYPTSVGFTKAFGEDAKRLVGLVGIFTGVGEVVGGSAFGLLGSKTTKKGIYAIDHLTHIILSDRKY